MLPIEGIYGFSGDHRFLSNMYLSPGCLFGELKVPSNEHKYQASKASNTKDAHYILFEGDEGWNTPFEAKRRGRQITIRNDWDQIKDSVMLEGLRQKFSNPDLSSMLLATDDLYIEETNAWRDYYWGVSNGKGLNKLGLMLMMIRKEIRNGLVR